MLDDWEDLLKLQVEPLTPMDRDYCVRVLNAAIERIERLAAQAEEVHWPVPGPPSRGRRGRASGSPSGWRGGFLDSGLVRS